MQEQVFSILVKLKSVFEDVENESKFLIQHAKFYKAMAGECNDGEMDMLLFLANFGDVNFDFYKLIKQKNFKSFDEFDISLSEGEREKLLNRYLVLENFGEAVKIMEEGDTKEAVEEVIEFDWKPDG